MSRAIEVRSAFFFVLLAACSGGQGAGGDPSGADPRPAPTEIGAARSTPAGVPSEYVHVPIGWTHPSCIHEVPEGAVIDSARDDVLMDGRVIAHYDPCPYKPIYGGAAEGPTTPQRGALQGPGYVGWVENTQQLAPPTNGAPGGFDWVSADMIVPGAPALQNTLTLYLFPALVSGASSGGATGCGILQPVLQWGGSPAGGGSYWSIGSWWWSTGGGNNGFHSGVSAVSTGDRINGVMHLAGYSSPFSKWAIYAYDTNTGANQTLNVSSGQCEYNVAYPVALEVQNGSLTSCSQVPSGSMAFENISLYAATSSWSSFTPVPYSPANVYGIGLSKPWCNFRLTTSGSTTTLWF
jgi:hypothetical protein